LLLQHTALILDCQDNYWTKSSIAKNKTKLPEKQVPCPPILSRRGQSGNQSHMGGRAAGAGKAVISTSEQ
jgi:hypothetical protein